MDTAKHAFLFPSRDPHPPGPQRPLPVSPDCCIIAQILLLIHSSPATSLFSETSKSQRNRSHPASDKEGQAPEDTDGISEFRGWQEAPPTRGLGGWGHTLLSQGAQLSPHSAVCSERAGACPRPGLSLGSGEDAERGQLFDGSQEWAPETIPEDSGLKDNPQ